MVIKSPPIITEYERVEAHSNESKPFGQYAEEASHIQPTHMRTMLAISAQYTQIAKFLFCPQMVAILRSSVRLANGTNASKEWT